MPILDFEFLAWLRLTAFFRDNLYADLVRLGADESDAFFWARSDAVKQADIVKLYQDYGRSDPELFERFIKDRWDCYKRIVETNSLNKKDKQ